MAHKILIVDDEEDFLQGLAICLEHAGYESQSACNGEEALDYVLKNTPHIIVLDVQMPKMNGLDFIRVIKKDTKFKKIPVLFLTAGAFEIAEEIETLAVAQDFLLKSVDNEQIIDRIAKFLN